jgi:hypothetical protein
MALLTHHLPADYAGDCFLASATATQRKQNEAKNTTRKRTENFINLMIKQDLVFLFMRSK